MLESEKNHCTKKLGFSLNISSVNVTKSAGKLHHFISNIYNFYVLFLLFTLTAIEEVFFHNEFLSFYGTMDGDEKHIHNLIFGFFGRPCDDYFCNDLFYFLH